MTPIFYQNCSGPGPLGDLDGSLSSRDFAYAEKMDHIAYMSCSGMTQPYYAEAYFTFKVGAYGANSGVQLTSKFFAETRNLSTSDKINVLQNNLFFGGARLTLNARNRSNLATVQTFASVGGGPFVGPLSTYDNANLLLANAPNFVNNFGGLKLEETLAFSASGEAGAANFRDRLANDLLLSVAYSNDAYLTGVPYILSPSEATPQTSAYGTGYNMTFGMGQNLAGAQFTQADSHVMTAIREYDLGSMTATGASWNCNPNWRFMIVRPAEANYYCPNALGNPNPRNQTESEQLQALRAVLNSSLWRVNLERRCIVPDGTATGLCYGTLPAPTFDPDGSSKNGPTYDLASCSPFSGNCPHYVSICKRR